ncbi:MAG: hypothetical protein WB802_02770 [Candidatus Dormiibacterota bacterium]|nr:hypothetical protein [Acidimicrobiales bacterium]
MQDLIYVALMVALTVIAWAFVVWCDRLIGPDDAALRIAARADAPSSPRSSGRRGQ